MGTVAGGPPNLAGLTFVVLGAFLISRANKKKEAAEKKKEDREVLINGVSMPGQTVVFSIEDKKVIIPAKKKSANLRVKIYPKKIKNKAEFRIVCIPQDKEAKRTQITVYLQPK